MRVAYGSSSSGRGSVKFTMFKIHGTIADTDLTGYVPKTSSVNKISTLSFCKIMVNENGLVQNATAVNTATPAEAGPVKVGSVPSTVWSSSKVYLSNDVACVNMPKFTNEQTYPAGLTSNVYVDSNGYAKTSFISSNVSFTVQSKSILAGNDTIAVNASTRDISNKITYSNLYS